MAKFMGLLTRSQIKESATKKGKKSDTLPLKLLHEHECKACPNNLRKDLHFPKLDPAGVKDPLIYILGDTPSVQDDEDGEHFVGSSGMILRKRIPKFWMNQIRFNHVTRCHPVQDAPPLPVEIECCRPALIRDIEATKPKIIFGFGGVPLRWILPGSVKNKAITSWRGRCFPVKIGSHACWYFPMLAPAYIKHIKGEKQVKGEKNIPGEEYEKVFQRDLQRAFQLAEDLPDANPVNPIELNERVVVIDDSVSAIEKALTWAAEQKIVAIDIETNYLRPYGKKPKLLTLAIGTASAVYSFPLDHPQASWTPIERRKIATALKAFLMTATPKIAHNTSFELEWLSFFFGDSITRACTWHDTMVAAYTLDARSAMHSLDTVSVLTLGVPLKEQSGVNRAELEYTNVRTVLSYNGLDTLYTAHIYKRQMKDLKSVGLLHVYKQHLPRIPTLVLAQRRGMYLDVEKVKDFKTQYQAKIEETKKQIAELPEVKRYQKRFGSFTPTAESDVKVMYRDVLKKSEGRQGKRYSVDKNVLGAIGGELAEKILDLRASGKMLSTYIEPLTLESERSVIHSDGMIHCTFNHTFTETGRLSSDKPNMQNFPKRSPLGKRIRSCFPAGPGEILIAVDHGQLEARVIGLMSKDRFLCRALEEDFDIHMVWAEKIVKIYPDTCRARYGSLKKKAMKSFRADVKNQMVFPSFYGSQMRSAARSLEMPDDVLAPLWEEFWDEHEGVLVWQKGLQESYQTKGYVECMSGRRRYAPLSYNMIINTPVQGTASDIVVDGMEQLSEEAMASDRPWLQARLNIHDDLTFSVPKQKEDEALESIITMMLTPRFDWVSVPLQVEVEHGPNWCDLSEIGKFTNRDLD